ncbi:threonylcarbamoyl-AMP synthase [Echinicola strongylocentroti]|uniref:Threonylcarbamoyl-AMP synthase n=1 Tax=Echinicola strongylocentroti TaxID=1795355 RepID=A0A2Z4IG37_9BACT|nr:L-threonylcarbamoyladenylate synthase [Echinicola strongylocentroti]AWW30111.1 threonylcarbamoyl-AMP synthase [Echinicola strongylocentroti]
MTEIGKDINKAKQLLEKGELVGIPTETVYGLAGNALDPSAVGKIFETKNRPSFDPLIVHTGSVEQISAYTTEILPELAVLAEQFWPGPLTLLLPKKSIVPDLVTSGLDQVAVRVPSHPLTRELLLSLDFPLAAPSANPFGYISPTCASHVVDQLDGKISYVLDGGSCQIGLESTIVGVEEGQITIYRLGGVEVSEIKKAVGNVLILPQSSSNPKSPGMLKSHYAPRIPFVVGDLSQLVPHYLSKGEKIGVLSFDIAYDDVAPEHQRILSKTGDFREAAQNLFAAMRYLDKQDVSVILSGEMPEKGLGKAVNDRLRRAAAR